MFNNPIILINPQNWIIELAVLFTIIPMAIIFHHSQINVSGNDLMRGIIT